MVRSGVIVTLASTFTNLFLPSIRMRLNRALCPTSKSMVGTTGTNNPMSRFRETSRPGNVSTCPLLENEMPDRTSKGSGVELKSVFASPLQDIFPDGYI